MSLIIVFLSAIYKQLPALIIWKDLILCLEAPYMISLIDILSKYA